MVLHYGWKYWARHLSMVVLAGFAFLMLTGNASAQLNYRTVVTFDLPVEVPGSTPQVLPAGTYTFKVASSQGTRNIVQITNEDETKVLTTILAVPATRQTATDETVLKFERRAADAPQALRAWFYPGRTDGQEFVYPKLEATELAAASNSPVPFSDNASLSEPTFTAAELPVGSGVEVAAVRSMLPSGQIAETAAPTTQLAQAIAPAAPARSTPTLQRVAYSESEAPVQIAGLPQTGSAVPQYAVVGLLSVMAGFALKVLSDR